MINENEYETRKLHISVPLKVYEHIRDKKLFKNIDGLITQLLIEKFELD